MRLQEAERVKEREKQISIVKSLPRRLTIKIASFSQRNKKSKSKQLRGAAGAGCANLGPEQKAAADFRRLLQPGGFASNANSQNLNSKRISFWGEF